jgi:hypothetical protein
LSEIVLLGIPNKQVSDHYIAGSDPSNVAFLMMLFVDVAGASF